MKQNTTVSFLRGFSAFWVVVAHCCIWGGWTGFILDPKVAVDVFMMISGYLMASTASGLHHREPFYEGKNWIRFYIRRFFRISPGYYICVIAAFLLSPTLIAGYRNLAILNGNALLLHIVDTYPDFSAVSFVSHLTYTFGLSPRLAFSTLLPDWSLSVEMQFYALFPLIFLAMQRVASVAKILSLSVISVVISYWSRKYLMRDFTEASLITYQFPFFLLGIFIHSFVRSSNRPIALAYLFGVVAFLVYAILMKTPHELVLAFSSVLLILSALKASVVVRFERIEKRFRIDQIFQNRLFSFMSDVSFSVYLFHGFVLSIIGSALESHLYSRGFSRDIAVGGVVLVVVSLTYSAAWISFKLIENPGVAFGKKLLQRHFSPDFSTAQEAAQLDAAGREAASSSPNT